MNNYETISDKLRELSPQEMTNDNMNDILIAKQEYEEFKENFKQEKLFLADAAFILMVPNAMHHMQYRTIQAKQTNGSK